MNNQANKSILFFSPHPDDHISAAGTILKLREKGYDYYEVLFTNGETGGQIGKIEVDKELLKEIRSVEFKKASDFIGTKNYWKLNMPTNDVEYSRESFFEMIRIIREVRPSLAILPHPDDYHWDHRQASVAAFNALVRADNSFALHLGARFRVPVIMYCRGLNPLTKADVLVDITNQYPKMEQLVSIYNSQITPRLKQYTESLPSLNGYYMRTQYAEEFEVPRNLPLFPSQVLADLE